jgi:aldehyde dehydrogenase (NAD+)
MAKNKQKETPAFDFNGGWNYAPSPESTSHVKLKDRYDLYIDGKFVAPSSGKYFKTINPATEKTLAEVAHGNDADVDKAVKAARKAYDRLVEIECQRTREIHLSNCAINAGKIA